jgi:hypothetical protein
MPIGRRLPEPDVDATEALAQRFPEHARSIRRLRGEDESFGAICEDYALALRALGHWQGAGDSARQRIEEYRGIVTDLEDEALAALKACAGWGGGTRRMRR